jgi:hypothetical protein
MPGYEVIGVENNLYWDGWLNTDALHCRTRGVMDFNMLYVDHRNVVFGEQEWQDSIAITSKFIAYSGAELKQDSLLVYYSIDGGEYQTATMTATGNPDEYVGYIKGYQSKSEVKYYVFGADESNRRYQQPVFGELDPHVFTMGEQAETTLTLNPTELVFEDENDGVEILTISNNTANDVVINGISVKDDLSYHVEHDFTLPYTLTIGESVEVEVYSDFAYKGDRDSELYIISSLGEQIVPIIDNYTVGLEENNALKVELYPNPVNNVLTVKGDNIVKVAIFNALGQEIVTVENRNEIDVTSLSNGLYFVRVTDVNGNVSVNKIVKE